MIYVKENYGKLSKVRQEAYRQAYKRSENYFLHDCYGKNSPAKSTAYLDCIYTMDEMKGRNGKIITYNIMEFTYGFLVTDDLTGVLYLYVITKYYNYCFEY